MVSSSQVLKQYFPFQSRFANIATQKMHYIDEGQGEVLLAVHGNPTWSFYYRNLIKQFRQNYRVVVPDHIGCGFSDKPSDLQYSYRLEQRVADLEQLVEQLQLKDITLVLHDWGGMIGLSFATRHPHLVKRIILMNSSGFPLPSQKPFPIALTLSRIPGIGALLIRGANAFALTASWVCCQRHRLPRTLRHLYRLPYPNWGQRIAVHRFVQDIPLDASHPSWQLVQQTSSQLEQFRRLPFFILWGEKDFVFDRHFLKTWRERLPEATVKSFADAGHYVLEDLGDEALFLIKQFLQQNPLAPSP